MINSPRVNMIIAMEKGKTLRRIWRDEKDRPHFDCISRMRLSEDGHIICSGWGSALRDAHNWINNLIEKPHEWEIDE